uniref:Innexin n=1 Tax=Heterorhabditis bacteriophora TaxID=37862 RepID=A0A1I7X024_HETBA
MLLYYLAAIFKGLHPRVDDDFVDKLNYHYTSAIIFAFAIIVSAKQYVVSYFCPNNILYKCYHYYIYIYYSMAIKLVVKYPVISKFVNYFHRIDQLICNEIIVKIVQGNFKNHLYLYQSRKSINVQSLTQMACDARMMDADARAATVQTIAGHMEDALEIQREVRVLGNVHHHTVQCVLMINMFNEKIFLFLWFWYFMVSIVSVTSMFHWILISFLPGQSNEAVANPDEAFNSMIQGVLRSKEPLYFI